MSVLKKMSPLEKIYFSLANSFAPFAIQLWIQADTLPALPALEQALACAAAANPGARLMQRNLSWQDTGIAPRVRSIPSGTPFSLSHPVLHEGLCDLPSPAIEVLYWPGAGLIFRCSHALMDAGGLLFFARETFRALRAEPLSGSEWTRSDRDYLAGLERRKRAPMLRPECNSPLGAPSRRSGYVWEQRSLPGQYPALGARLVSELDAMARKHRAGACTRIMLPVDLRRVDGALRSTRNFSRPLFLGLSAPASWSALHARVLNALERREECVSPSVAEDLLARLPSSVIAACIRRLHDWQVGNDRYLVSAVVSSLGDVSLASFSMPGFSPHSLRMLPFDTPGAGLTLITMQHENGTEIAASAPAATGSDGRLSAALDHLCNALERKKYSLGVPPECSFHPLPSEGPTAALPAGLTLPHLIAQQAAAHPQRIALRDGDISITYAELETRSVACAGALRAAGVNAGDRVALYSTKSAHTIVALLGILRSGAAFVPIDPAWPQKRMNMVLEDCRPACFVTSHAGAASHDVPCIAMTELMQSEPRAAFDPAECLPESVAYVLYTSGSTGKPKGVVVGHRSVTNYILWARDAYLKEMSSPAVFPFFTSLAFDLTLTALFVPLASGGEVRVFSQNGVLDTLRAILADRSVNAVKLTPSHLSVMAELGLASSGLQTFVVGGEALPAHLASVVCDQLQGHADIFNEYGPTEATVGCIVHRFDRKSDTTPIVPIGLPIMNTQVLLLDDPGSPAPDGKVGEICLAGDCLALGYLDRSQEANRYCEHPFRVGERIYRTGDRAQRRADGTLLYVGRIDDQVKVRGYRVELGEIEAMIAASGLCRGCAVLSGDIRAGAGLIAFVAWRAGDEEAALREWLESSLPHYMIPARIIAIDEIPLNVNGKVDKARLLLDASTQNALPVTCTPLETGLIEIVTELIPRLGKTVDPEESLLELGLDSLQTMLLMTHAARRFLTESSQQAFFDSLDDFLGDPTVRHLAIIIDRLRENPVCKVLS
ncbi:amino acid adenylation domain-containing protein [Noviherbaspirillum humi]|uniref:Amino acid adenylation domain-containing protein n=1 Tax=Noviherbaspirillum humi TaxID=1688639 RepID=A0A239FBN6_9BURK|nr:non-ribosomal peptide synthetase [Noviherbaspirillum humi]SNS53723.1 amino acid adenylation domain-containing protein [Noviherbaspirillum humi]